MTTVNPRSSFLFNAWNVFFGNLNNEDQECNEIPTDHGRTSKIETICALKSENMNDQEDVIQLELNHVDQEVEEMTDRDNKKEEMAKNETNGLDELLFELSGKSRDLESLKRENTNLMRVNGLLKQQLDKTNDKIKPHIVLVEKYKTLKSEYESFKQEANRKIENALEDFRVMNRRRCEIHFIQRDSDLWIFKEQFKNLEQEYEKRLENLKQEHEKTYENLELDYQNKFRIKLDKGVKLIQRYEVKQKELEMGNETLRKKVDETVQAYDIAIAERRHALQLVKDKEIELSQLNSYIEERENARVAEVTKAYQRQLGEREDTGKARVAEVMEACQLELAIVRRLQKEKEEALMAELFCPICTEMFRDAVTLDCSHTFCDKCICQWGNTSGSGGICPVCRNKIKHKVKTLVLNTFVAKISEITKK